MSTAASDHVTVNRLGDTFVVGEDPGAAAGRASMPGLEAPLWSFCPPRAAPSWSTRSTLAGRDS